MLKHMNVPVFIPHLGCGHSCAFCNQRFVTNVQAVPSPESVAFSVREALKTRGGRLAEIAFFGGSFTGIPRADQKAYLLSVQPFLEKGEATGIRISTRPDYIDKETVAFLKAYGVKTIELGAQSMRSHVLSAARRGHTPEDTVRAAACIRSGGVRLGLQMMTGLPLSTPEDEAYTASAFVELGAEDARIYPTVVFRDTPLCAAMESGSYCPPTALETIDRAAAALSILEAGGVRVIRIGLQETETLAGTVCGGAYHPAIGEMVRARAWRMRLDAALSMLSGDTFTVHAPERLTSLFVGQNRENFHYLEEKHACRLQLYRGERAAVSDTKRTIFLEGGNMHD